MADSCYSPNSGKRNSMSNTGKPARTSLSILKPLKARCPLQDLDLVPNVEDDTTTTTTTFTAMRRRRVSFAGVNKVKEFHTAAESLTVHHTPAYDEPFTTTMSSDSSSHHHLTDSKMSDGTGLDQMSLTSCIDANFVSGMDAVLDLTVKSTDNSSYKRHSEIDFESKENLTDNIFSHGQNTYYEADMECTTPHIVNHMYYDSKNTSFANKSMEFTSMISRFSEGMQSSKSSMMEFTDVIHGPSSFLQNDSGTKQYESMEFRQVDAGIVASQEGFDDSFPSTNLLPNSEFYYGGQNESQNDFGMEFNEPSQKANIFTNQNVNSSKCEPPISNSNPLRHADVIFNSRKSIANDDFDDSNEMSFGNGMTGVISQPLIEELEITNNVSRNVSIFVESDGQNIENECSNAEGSEMSITEANVFSNPENTMHQVSANLETGKKSVSENIKTKQSDHVLSFLRSYSGTEKSTPALPTSFNLSSEYAEAVKRSVEKETVNRSSNHLTSSHMGDVSITNSHAVDFSNALSNDIKSNSSVAETSVSKTSELSMSKNSSMEFTKAVTNNIRFGNSSVGDLSISKTTETEFTNGAGNNVSDMSSSKNCSMEFTKAVTNNIELNNSSAGDMSVSKTSTMGFTNAVGNNVSKMCVSKNGSMDLTKAVSNNIRFVNSIPSLSEDHSKLVNVTSEDIFSKTAETNNLESSCEKGSSVFETTRAMRTNDTHTENLSEKKCATMLDAIDFNATSVVTSTQEPKLSENVSFSDNLDEEKSVHDTVDFDASNVITSTQESRDIPIATKGRKSISVEAFLSLDVPVERKAPANFDLVDQQILAIEMELIKGVRSSIQSSNNNFSENLSRPSNETDEELHCKNEHGSSQTSSGSQPMDFTNVDAFDVKANLGCNSEKLESEHASSQDYSGSQPMEFTNVNAFDEKANLDGDSNNTNGECASSQDYSGSQLMEFTNVNAFDEKANLDGSSENTNREQARSQNSSGSHDFTNVNAFDEKANPDGNSESTDGFSDADLHFGSVKNRRKSRRSELFVPLQKPLLSENKMNIIEESEIGDDFGSLNSANNISSENFSQALATAEENDGDKVRCESFLTSKPAHVFNSSMAKFKVNKSELNFDCSYKINDSQMFTKSMLDQTSHGESSVSEPLKLNNSESTAVSGKTGNVLLASMIHTDEVSLSCEFSASVNLSTKKEVLISESNITKSVTFHQNELAALIMNEDTDTFSHFMKAPVESPKNSTLIRPMMNSTIMANIFEESQCTIPKESIPRSVYLNDDIDCPSFSGKSGLTPPKVTNHETSGKINENFESLSVIRTSDNHESFVGNEPSQEVLDDKKNFMDKVNEVSIEKYVHNNNGDESEHQYAKEDSFGSTDLYDVSFPEKDFTINEELLKNVTIDRSKPRKSLRKSRCFTDLDDSITLQHEEGVKKVKILNESCNMTGIAKLPDLTTNSAEVSPSDKSASKADESKMDVSIIDENPMSTLNFDHNDSEAIVNTVHEQIANIDTSSHKIPEIIISDVSEQRKSSESMVEEFDLEQKQNPTTPRSCLKKVQNLSSAAKSTPVTNSTLKGTNVKSETKNVLFVDSGPKQRGFVKNAANNYESLVVNATPLKFSECKRVLDANYPKEKRSHLKVHQYLETAAQTNATNTSVVKETEALDSSSLNRVVPQENHNESMAFSPEDKFEKSSYIPSSSSNTSMIVHDDHDSNISPVFKTPRSMAKLKNLSAIASPKTPTSPARKRQKLPFGSTPVKHFNNKEEKSNDSQPGSSKNDSSNFVLSPENPSSNERCPEFSERFEAETRVTKNEWNVLEANSTVWSFEFLDGLLQLVIHFKSASSNAPVSVDSIKFSSVHPDGKPIKVIGQRILLEKYPAQRLKSLCKNSSSVFDVLHMIGNDAIYARKVMYSLEGMFLAVFTKNSAIIELTSLRPNHLAEVTVDLSSWKSLSSSSISIDNQIGNIRLPKIRSLFEECEKTHDCVRQFYNKCLDYINSINCTGPKI